MTIRKLKGNAIIDASITETQLTTALANKINNSSSGANNAANTVAVYANGTLTYANANVNFVNTATINVSVTQNTATLYANVAFTVNSSAVGGGSASGNINFVSKFTSNTGVGNSSIFNDATGNVGIGTTTPNGNLHVTGTILDTPILSISASATYGENAAGKIIYSTSATAITVTIGAATTSGFSYTIIRKGAGNVTIANVSTVTRLNTASINALNVVQYGAVTAVYTATNEVVVFGDFTS